MVRTINQSYQEKYQQDKKRKILKKVFLFSVLLFSLVGGSFYALFFSHLFNIREISIASVGSVKSQEVRNTVDGYLAEKPFFISRFENIFLADAEEIGALISRQFPAVENVKVEKKYFHALAISISQKKTAGIWCYQKIGQCFHFDRQGIAFDFVTETSGALLVNVNDQRGDFDRLGQPVTGQETLDFVFEIDERLEKAKIETLKFMIPMEEDFRFDAKTVEGWVIYFSTKDDLSKQFNSLEIFLAQKITPEKRSQLQYIDLTVPNRVYYK